MDQKNCTRPENPKTLLSLDAASKTGWAIYIKGQLVCSGVFRGDKVKDPFDRLLFLYGELAALLTMHQIDVIIMEDTFFGKNAKTAKYLDCLRGALIVAGKQRGVSEIKFLYNKMWKKAAVGFGDASKKDSRNCASIIAGREIKSEDEADAICIGAAYLGVISGRQRKATGDGAGSNSTDNGLPGKKRRSRRKTD